MRFNIKRIITKSAVSVLFASLSASVWSGVFTVTPVRIYMTPQDRAIAVTVTNDGDETLVMQADIYEWKQKANGEDDLTLSEDLFLSPPILKVAPKSRQVVRLARVKKTQQGPREITYRLIVREIPEAKPANKDIQVQIALAFSMPVFITPPGAKSALNCSATRLTVDKVQATCENTGNAHSHPTSLLLTNNAGDKIASQDVGAYILPDIKRNFELQRKDGSIPAGKAKLAVSLVDGTTQTFDVVIGP